LEALIGRDLLRVLLIGHAYRRSNNNLFCCSGRKSNLD
jgi:hypothetical protein